jgi:DNA-binding XRE family transcriptional regulator
VADKLTFAQRLFQAKSAYEGRVGERITQKQLGEMVGVSQPTVADWENGVRTPSIEQVELLSEALGVSPGWLAFGEGVMHSGHQPPVQTMPPGRKVKVEAPKKRRAK